MTTSAQRKVSDSHGVRLTRFLEKEWDALYTTRGEWCRKVGIAGSTVYRWSTGTEPDLANMQIIASGLGRKLTDILFHAGYIDESELRLRTATPARERFELDEVIRSDPRLSTQERKALLAVHEAFMSMDDMKTSVRVSRKD